MICFISYHTHLFIEDVSQVGYVLEHCHIATYPATETQGGLSLYCSSFYNNVKSQVQL